jgi:uncharacterized protein (DUF4415 family)
MTANKRSIKSDLKKVDAYKGKPSDYDGAPELTKAQLASAVRKRGRPPISGEPKSQVTLRLDADVLSSYRALGDGWQSRINADLRKARKLG